MVKIKSCVYQKGKLQDFIYNKIYKFIIKETRLTQRRPQYEYQTEDSKQHSSQLRQSPTVSDICQFQPPRHGQFHHLNLHKIQLSEDTDLHCLIETKIFAININIPEAIHCPEASIEIDVTAPSCPLYSI